jgi:hypothetical protein
MNPMLFEGPMATSPWGAVSHRPSNPSAHFSTPDHLLLVARVDPHVAAASQARGVRLSGAAA